MLTQNKSLALVFVVVALLVLSVSFYSAAKRTLALATDGGRKIVPETPSKAATGRIAAIDYDLNAITAAYLFGRVERKSEQAVQEAPETKLRLTLAGVVASSDTRYARALIGVDAAKVKNYAVGQQIDGTDAKLHTVEELRVILQRGGQFESLPMERSLLGESGDAAQTVGTSSIGSVQNAVRRDRSRRRSAAAQKAPFPI